jgi:hypothetical protein
LIREVARRSLALDHPLALSNGGKLGLMGIYAPNLFTITDMGFGEHPFHALG